MPGFFPIEAIVHYHILFLFFRVSLSISLYMAYLHVYSEQQGGNQEKKNT